jgi:hypothetical protein
MAKIEINVLVAHAEKRRRQRRAENFGRAGESDGPR